MFSVFGSPIASARQRPVGRVIARYYWGVGAFRQPGTMLKAGFQL
jgi:hypothetical protein